MKIRKMTACFGRLENETLELGDGLNVIYAPNESGKSTWCAFIRAMLYGVDSSQRERAGFKPDKLRFAPWSGSPMSGEMELHAGGAEITLVRETRLPSAPMKEFSALYTGTANKVDGISESDAGLILTGMNKTVFDSSVFVRQSGLRVSGSEELEKRISAIVSTGEEENSYTAADRQLRAWLRKRRYNKSGWMPAVEDEIARQEELISSLSGAAGERAALEARLAAAQKKRALLVSEVARDGQRIRQTRLQSLSDSREAVARAEGRLSDAKEKTAAMKAQLDSGVFGGKTPEDAEAAVRLDIEKLGEVTRRVPKALPAWILIALGVVVEFVGIYSFFPLMFVGAAALFAGGALGFYTKYKARDARRAGDALCIKYGVSDEGRVMPAFEKYAEKYAMWSRAQEAVKALSDELDAARAAQAEADRALVSESGDAEAGAHLEELTQLEGEIALLKQNISLYEGKFGALGDPMVIQSKLDDMHSRLAGLQSQYEALTLAINTLREANDEMQSRFAPQLSRRASEIMTRLTGGRYERLVFDRDLSALAKRGSDAAGHEVSYLSSGTADQLYLALRLAICELALPDGCDCPLIFDDALVNFDEERMALALDMLEEMSKTRQIIVFSCHDREKKYIEQKNK